VIEKRLRELLMVEEYSCADKMAFDTPEQAEAAAVVAYHQRGVMLKVYHCTSCELWHLSSQ
jgi:hypothetical protein